MKAALSRGDANRALSAIMPAIGKKNATPILGAMRVTANGNSATLRGFNMDMAIDATVPARVQEGGVAVVEAHRFASVVGLWPSDELDFGSTAANAKVSATDIDAEFTAYAPDEYPEMAAHEPEATIKITAGDLLAGLRTARFSISTEETRYYLNGIFIEASRDSDGRFVTMTATDGRRLTTIRRDAEITGNRAGWILPRAAVNWLVQNLPREAPGELLTIGIGLNFDLAMPGAGLAIRSKMIDGTFPDWRRVVPSNFRSEVNVDAGALTAAMRLRMAMRAGKDAGFKMLIEETAITVSVEDQGAKMSRRIPATAPRLQAPIEIGFSARYMLDLVACLKDGRDDGHLVLSIVDAASPAMARWSADEHRYSILMPMWV